MRLISKAASIAAVAILVGCGGGGGNGPVVIGDDENFYQGAPNVYAYPQYELTQQNKDDLAFMGNEERLAYDLYTYLYNYHLTNSNTEIRQLSNIANQSETTHIKVVRDLVNKYEIEPDELTIIGEPVASRTTPQDELPAGKYDVEHVQELYDALEDKGKQSVRDALEVGCMVEVTDINDLNPKIDAANASGAKDLVEAFEFLRAGSYNHYWAFDRGLKSLGISDGCCSLGDEWCHPEYPQR
ncbi:MAG: DUF2202 domain-containing protein [Epsilonproteobacteria bacterium]|nr:DUF2202 domain-containing protein [Campylobacterota bacterium]